MATQNQILNASGALLMSGAQISYAMDALSLYGIRDPKSTLL